MPSEDIKRNIGLGEDFNRFSNKCTPLENKTRNIINLENVLLNLTKYFQDKV